MRDINSFTNANVHLYFQKANKFLLFYINYQEINIYFKKQSHFKEVIPSFDWKGKEKESVFIFISFRLVINTISPSKKRQITMQNAPLQHMKWGIL